MNLDDYLLDQEGLDWGSLLSGWRELLPAEVTVWLVNRFGEPFLVYGDGSVHHLEPQADTVEQVADSREDFSTKLDKGDNANQWLMIPLVNEAVNAGMKLGRGQCYGFTQPTILEGDYSLSNVRVKTLEQYYSFLADLHSQIRDLPDGVQVRLKWTD